MQSKKIEIGTSSFKTTLVDTSGYDRDRKDIFGFFAKSDAVVVVFDITKRKNFDQHASKWCKDLAADADKNQGDRKKFLVLIGNKLDLEKERKVQASEAREMLKSVEGSFAAVSYEELSASADPSGVMRVFTSIVENVAKSRGLKIEKPKPEDDDAVEEGTNSDTVVAPVVDGEGGCCIVS